MEKLTSEKHSWAIQKTERRELLEKRSGRSEWLQLIVDEKRSKLNG